MILLTLFLIALTIEGALSTIPLTFVVLLNFLILKRDNSLFYLAFFGGIILDLLAVRPIGITSIYLLTAFFVVLLYERKFEINSIFFVGLAGFLGSLGLLFITSFNSMIVLQAIFASCIALVIFKIYESRLGVL